MVLVLIEYHPNVYDLTILADVAEEFSARQSSQEQYKPDMPADLVQLIQTEFSKICQQVFSGAFPVRWKKNPD